MPQVSQHTPWPCCLQLVAFYRHLVCSSFQAFKCMAMGTKVLLCPSPAARAVAATLLGLVPSIR